MFWAPGHIPSSSVAENRVPTLQRSCDCEKENGGASGICASCSSEKGLGVQPKLSIGPPNDTYEQEADRIADRVVSGSAVGAVGMTGISQLQRQPEEEEEEPLQMKRERLQRQASGEEEEEEGSVQLKGERLQRQASGDEEEEEELLQPKVSAAGPARAPLSGAISAAAAVAQGGTPLSRSARSYFEPRFGRDLSHVRLHTDTGAAHAARGIGARAYTLNNHIAFAPGQFDPDTTEGRRLMAHELTHTLQQGMISPRLQRENGDDEEPVAPTQITFNFDRNMPIPATAGGVTGLTATTDGTDVAWSITASTGTIVAGTEIDPDSGAITLAAAQSGAVIDVAARNSAGTFTLSFRTASAPTGIDATSVDSSLGTATTYGAAYQHTFTSADGSSDVLTNLRVGERFPALPTPAAATHRIAGAAWPFGRGRDFFTLQTGTLANDASGAFVLDSAGQFAPPPTGSTLAQGDNVTSPKWDAATNSGIKVGDHVQSHSNPRPRNRLPVTLTVDQELHFFNPRAASGHRWTRFITLAHSRTLKRDSTDIRFVTTVNGVEHDEDYEGPPALTNLSASPVSTPRSEGPPSGGGTAPPPRTVALSAELLPDRLPTGMTINWRIVGNARGCTLTADPSDDSVAELTVGTQAGTVTIEIATSAGGSADRVSVRIT